MRTDCTPYENFDWEEDDEDTVTSNKDRREEYDRDGVTVVYLGEGVVSLNGSDIDFLRHRLSELLNEGKTLLGVDMKGVINTKPGLLGVLGNLKDKNADVYLYNPEDVVKAWIWVRHQFRQIDEGIYKMMDEDEISPLTEER